MAQDEGPVAAVPHFVAVRPASLVVDLDVVRDSAVGFHFAALSVVRPHEALSHRVGKCFVPWNDCACLLCKDVDGSARGNSFRGSREGKLAVARELALPPVRTFAFRIEFNGLVPVQRPHDADAREHRRPAERRMTSVSTMLERTVAWLTRVYGDCGCLAYRSAESAMHSVTLPASLCVRRHSSRIRLIWLWSRCKSKAA